jgi:hypothetical protein
MKQRPLAGLERYRKTTRRAQLLAELFMVRRKVLALSGTGARH